MEAINNILSTINEIISNFDLSLYWQQVVLIFDKIKQFFATPEVSNLISTITGYLSGAGFSVVAILLIACIFSSGLIEKIWRIICLIATIALVLYLASKGYI